MKTATLMGDIDIIRNVVARHRVNADTVGDPKELLREFERMVSFMEIPPEKLLPAKKVLEERVASGIPGVNAEVMAASDMAFRALAKVKNAHVVTDPGHQLFLSILQTYTLPPALRKKVEIASRAYLKPTKPRIKAKGGAARYLEYITIYEKFFGTLTAHVEVAKLAIAQGKGHASEGEGATKIKVGPFTLVNTGGFSEKQMNEVVDVMQKVTSLAQSSGLGQVCYGEVQVTNTISGRNVLAFYLIAKDELFVRANVKSSTDSVQTVLHELGHRYEKKFLKSGGADVLYRILEGQDRRKRWDIEKKQKKPEPGDTLESKGKTYVVRMTLPARDGYKVHLTLKDNPKAEATVPLDTFWAMKGVNPHNFDEDPNYIGFVTDYAKRGGPSENFAEMFSYYCMGRLPVLQSVPFEEAVFGTSKSADVRMAQRVATRHLTRS